MNNAESREQIEYNFNIDYYKFFIMFMLRFNSFVTEDKNYKMALKELELRVSELNHSIHKFSEEEKVNIEFEIKNCKDLIAEFENVENDRHIKHKEKPELLSKIGFEVERELFKIYSHLLGVMDRMNMIFKKETKDNRADIFKSY